MSLNFNFKSNTKIDDIIKSELTNREITDIDMRVFGNIIMNIAKFLSKKVNDELLEPISRWLDDPEWLKRFQTDDKATPKWAEYKRKQRQWTQQQKAMATERLRLYWQEIHKKRRFRKELSKILCTNTQSRNCTDAQLQNTANLQENFLTPIIAPFSPKEQYKAETIYEFQQARTMSISNLLPWKLLLSTELTSAKHFKDLKRYCPTKNDKASKLIHLMQMETDRKVKISQDKPFGDILIKPLDIDQEQNITIKDRDNRSYDFDWKELSDNQKSKIIADIKANQILCKTA